VQAHGRAETLFHHRAFGLDAGGALRGGDQLLVDRDVGALEPTKPTIAASTDADSAADSRPARRRIRAGSMQATLTGRTTDGADSPARRGSEIGWSCSIGGFAALVIIATQTNPAAASARPEITSAGRRFSARRSL
jgi:hypothetical protein